MPKVSINQAAPDFTLEDYQGNPVSLSDYKEKKWNMMDLHGGEIYLMKSERK